MLKYQKVLRVIARASMKGMPCPSNQLLKKHHVDKLIAHGYIRVVVHDGYQRQVEILKGRYKGLCTRKPRTPAIRIIDQEMRQAYSQRGNAPQSGPHAHHCEIFGGHDDAEIARNMKRGVRHDEVVSAL